MFSLIDNDEILPKMTSNLAEVSARNGWVIAIGPNSAVSSVSVPGGDISSLIVPECDSFWMPVNTCHSHSAIGVSYRCKKRHRR